MTRPKYGKTTRGHILIRLLRKTRIDPIDECWIWTGASSGKYDYGCIGYKGKVVRTHRVSYELFFGTIPNGTEIDHKCRVHRCWNPQHLEAVVHRENVLRGDRFKIDGHQRNAKATCSHGHPWTAENIAIRSDGIRKCMLCEHVNYARKEQRRRERLIAAGGHPRTPFPSKYIIQNLDSTGRP
jgi:hypothetical protein